MARSKSKRRIEVKIDGKELDRFAGSSDEENPKEHQANHEDEDEDSSPNSSLKDSTMKIEEDDPINDVGDEDEEEILEPDVLVESSSAKMANAMARILGTTKNKHGASSVVLSKTTTPLQRMQLKEKEQVKALKEKRKTNRERNLAALHIPLSVATTNTIEIGGQSVANELEKERLHRRVATRGVVALFNAITQHQKASEIDHSSSRQKKDDSKVTKHSFLNKIKDAASTASADAPKEEVDTAQPTKEAPKWDALKDDYLLNPKKNWDQESSEEDDDSVADDIPNAKDAKGAEQASKKRRRKGNKQ